MDFNDEKKLEIAIQYVTRIAEGKNPVNNTLVEDSVLNNPNVTRCMYFVKDILEDVKSKELKKSRNKSTLLDYPLEHAINYKDLSEKTISEIAKQLNKDLDITKYKRISFSTIRGWLIKNEYLFIKESPKYKRKITIPTKKGREAGMRFEERTSEDGEMYIVVLYNKEAQALILKNLEEIIYKK